MAPSSGAIIKLTGGAGGEVGDGASVWLCSFELHEHKNTKIIYNRTRNNIFVLFFCTSILIAPPESTEINYKYITKNNKKQQIPTKKFFGRPLTNKKIYDMITTIEFNKRW